jgi:SulP family sulfate permease
MMVPIGPFSTRPTPSPTTLPRLFPTGAPPSGPRIERLVPLVRTLRSYRAAYLRPDFIAGLTTALFTIPQSLAYALIAGFRPVAGLSTAVAASILGATFGSSEFVIDGPTNAISVMVAANAALFAAHGDPVQAIVLLTLMVGALQLIASLLRAGSLVRFVSEPVLTGFTAGAGLYIVINQIPSFLGIGKAAIPATVWGLALPKAAAFDLLRVSVALPATNGAALSIGAFTFLTIRVLQWLEKRVSFRVPANFIGVALATCLVAAAGLDTGTGAHRVRVVRDIEPLMRAIPHLHLPRIDLKLMRNLFVPALSIAVMGAVESIAISKVLAGRARHPFEANRQIFGEGMANLGAALVGGFASAGSFSRTAANYEAGAVTRVSAALSGLLALLIVIVLAPVANRIPIAALAGTLVHVGLRLVDVGRWRAMFSTTPGDRAVLVVTFVGVLFVEHLETALILGVWLSLYFALRRAEGFKMQIMKFDEEGALRAAREGDPGGDSEVAVVNLQGELFFAAADEIQAGLLKLLDGSRARFVVLRLQEAYNLDATAAIALSKVAVEARGRGGRLVLCGVRPGMLGTLARSRAVDVIGRDAVFPHEGEMLASTRRASEFAHRLAAQAAAALEPGPDAASTST